MSEKVFLIPIDIWIYGIIILILSGSLFGYLISTGEKLTLDEEERTEKEFQKEIKKLMGEETPFNFVRFFKILIKIIILFPLGIITLLCGALVFYGMVALGLNIFSWWLVLLMVPALILFNYAQEKLGISNNPIFYLKKVKYLKFWFK